MAKRTPPKSEVEDDVLKAVEAAEAADDAPREDPKIEVTIDPVREEEPSGPDARPVEADAEVSRVMPDPVVAEPPPAPPAPPPRKSGGGFVATALGGVVAAAAGYALSIFVPFPGVGASDTPAFDAAAEVQALTERVASLEARPGPDSTLADRIAALESRPAPEPVADLGPLTEALATLEARMEAVESRPPSANAQMPTADVAASIAALQAEIDAVKAANAEAGAGIEALAAEAQARLAEAEAQAAALKSEAEETARRARQFAAVGRVQAALESGAPFASALADLDGIAIPDALLAVADTGLPALASLEEAFAPAARSALEASLQANMGETWSERVSNFLQSTTGARSLTPREGTDPDAVLSRAEAALREANLPQALTELEGLPPEGLAAMADWIALAQQRIDTLSAAAALSAAVEG